MKVGDKIRDLRTLKKLSQENMAKMLDMSLVAYGDIERDKKKDLTLARLEQIAGVLEISVLDILGFEDTVSDFFDQCNNASVATGKKSKTINNYDTRELKHELEKAQLREAKLQSDLKLCQAEKEKAELEVKYWREKCEK
jgi:transcriptional regulator with XRE-family HTH domain